MKFGATNEVGGKHLVGYKKLVGGVYRGFFLTREMSKGAFWVIGGLPPFLQWGKP